MALLLVMAALWTPAAAPAAESQDAKVGEAVFLTAADQSIDDWLSTDKYRALFTALATADAMMVDPGFTDEGEFSDSFTVHQNRTTLAVYWFGKAELAVIMFKPSKTKLTVVRSSIEQTDAATREQLMAYIKNNGTILAYYENDNALVRQVADEFAAGLE